MVKKIKLIVVALSVILFAGCSGGGENNGTAQGISSPEGGYNVYGGNQFVSGGIVELKDFTFLGSSTETEVFSGSYSYYAVGNDGDGSSISIDSIGGSNGEYYNMVSASNITDSVGDSLVGSPDGKYIIINAQGYVLIDASGDNLESITVFK